MIPHEKMGEFKIYLEKRGLNPVLLLDSLIFFPLFLVGKKKRVRNNQFSYKTGLIGIIWKKRIYCDGCVMIS